MRPIDIALDIVAMIPVWLWVALGSLAGLAVTVLIAWWMWETGEENHVSDECLRVHFQPRPEFALFNGGRSVARSRYEETLRKVRSELGASARGDVA